MNNFYCPRIYHGLTLSNITKNSIDYSVCCWAKDSIIRRSGQVDFYHSDIQSLRDINATGVLPSKHCHDCLSQEQVAKKSMRLGYLETHGTVTYTPSLQYLDINIDYTCNLACVTCGPELSTTWRNELKIKGVDVRPNLDQFIKDYLEQLDFSQLKEIRFWGGEPFLTLTHKKILEFIATRVDTSSVKLMYNTNGTQIIDNDTRQLIERFKFARISFSVDAIGNQFDYLRYPGKWADVEQNLFWWKNNLPHNSMLSMTLTASILNVLDLNSVFEWHRNNFTHSKFGDPIEIYVHQAFGIYGLESMPADMIQELQSIKNYCQPWIQNLSNLGTAVKNLPQIIETILNNDHRRALDLAEFFPAVARFIQYQKSI
jgi:sulfatase maturation enzyme AslB (radical SAM superfamily)